MKNIFGFAASAILVALFVINTPAQKNPPKDEWFQQIAKLSNTKKSDDRELAYQMGKKYLAEHGKDNDDKAKKVKAYVENYRMAEFNKAADETKMANALKYGEDILADQPENSYVTMNLGYTALEMMTKNQDKSFGVQGIMYAKKTLELFAAGKVPADFKPFKDQNEVTALMYYTIGSYTVDSNVKEAAIAFQKASLIDSQVKAKSYIYYIAAFHYEKVYETLAADFQTKYAGKPETDAMKAERAEIDKVIDRMIDAYARTVKCAEPESNPSLGMWKDRLKQVYTFRKGSDKGLNELVSGILATPMAEIL